MNIINDDAADYNNYFYNNKLFKVILLLFFFTKYKIKKTIKNLPKLQFKLIKKILKNNIILKIEKIFIKI